MVTHDDSVAARASRIISLQDGTVVGDNGNPASSNFTGTVGVVDSRTSYDHSKGEPRMSWRESFRVALK